MSIHTQQVAAAFTGPAAVQGAMAVARSGVNMTTKFIVGEPEKLQGAAPMFTQIGSEVGQLAQQTQSRASSISSWEGAARDAFNSKVQSVTGQLSQLQPVLSQVTALLNQAAQVSIQTAQSIATTVRAKVAAVTTAYHTAKAAAVETLGASLAKWLAWATGQAARLLAQVMQLARQAASMLQQLGQTLQQAAKTALAVAKGLFQLYRSIQKGIAQGLLKVGKFVIGSPKLAFKEESKLKTGDHDSGKRRETSRGDYDKMGGFDPLKEKLKVKLGSFSGDFGLFRDDSDSGQFGEGTEWNTSTQAGLLMADGNFFASKHGVGAEGSVFTGARTAGDISWSDKNGIVNGSADGALSVGAGADAKAVAGLTGAQAKVDAFAGAKAEGSVGGDVAGIGATAKGEAWAGVGAELDAKAKWEDGKLEVGLGAGAGFGFGGKVGAEFTIEPAKTWDAAKTAGGAVVDFFQGD